MMFAKFFGGKGGSWSQVTRGYMPGKMTDQYELLDLAN